LRTVARPGAAVDATTTAPLTVVVSEPGSFARGAVTARLTAVALAHGWLREGPGNRAEDEDVLRFVPDTP
jgi:hypothetical protein